MSFNKKFFNLAAWITLFITYVFPYQSTDGFATHFGYPFSFLTVYKTSIKTSLLKSENVDLLTLAIDILIIYFVINFANALLVKVKSNEDKNRIKNSK
jgi:hypothetical protein